MEVRTNCLLLITDAFVIWNYLCCNIVILYTVGLTISGGGGESIGTTEDEYPILGSYYWECYFDGNHGTRLNLYDRHPFIPPKNLRIQLELG